MYTTEHPTHQTTMSLPNMINMRGYEELLDRFHGCSSLFALSRYSEMSAFAELKTDQLV